MPALRLRYQTIEFDRVDIHLRTLRNTQEFSDDDGVAAGLGISSAAWPIFGVVWAAGEALARLMVDFDIAGKRILEVGCGIGLASLVLNHRLADITATDHHPQAEAFLRANVALNGGRQIPFVRTGWDEADESLGGFDLIIGSDILYASETLSSLSVFIDRHARPRCQLLIVDPRRGQVGRFSKRMDRLGYRFEKHEADPGTDLAAPFEGLVLSYQR